MESTMAFAGEETKRAHKRDQSLKAQLHDSILQLFDWLERNDYSGYDTFDRP